MERRRESIIQELIQSEANYILHLRLAIKFFEQPLLENGLIPKHVVSMIFGNLDQILTINEELLTALRNNSVAKAFLTIMPYLKLYASYARSHEQALKTLLEWEQRSTHFTEFRRVQELHSELGGLKLNALLITPVQRIPRYKLLLDDLLKHTDSRHEDRVKLSGVVEQISAMAAYINDHIKLYDSTQRMVEIQKRLSGDCKPNIIEPGRRFIKEGILNKVSSKGKSHERMFFLFSDTLMYAKIEPGGGFSCCCMLPLHKCEVAMLLGSKDKRKQGGLFKVRCLDKELLLYSDKQKDVTDWITVLTAAIGVYRSDRLSLRKESSGRRPIRGKQIALVQNSPQLSTKASNRMKTACSSACTQILKRTMDAALSCTPVMKRKHRPSLL